jgi:hypothetical protein
MIHVSESYNVGEGLLSLFLLFGCLFAFYSWGGFLLGVGIVMLLLYLSKV